MRTALTIGRESDNDFVINHPIVSGHHARLTWEGLPGQALLEDLGSSNGTAIGQVDRKVSKAAISESDTVYFGNHAVPAADLLAWVDPSFAPSLSPKGDETIIGRDPGCHRVFDRPTVSGRHAKLRRAGGRIILEDLGSSNGTFVEGRRVEGPTEVHPGDLIVLGADAFRLAVDSPTARTQKADAIRPAPGPRPESTRQVGTIPPPSRPSPTLPLGAIGGAPIGPAPAGGWIYPATLAGLLIQAPLLALVIGLLPGGAAASLFGLGLAALWFGLSTAVFGTLLDPGRPVGARDADHAGFWLSRLAILGALAAFECLLAQVIVFPLGGLKGPGLSAFGLLVLASGSGLAAGLMIALLSPRPPVAWAVLAGAFVALALFGGGPWSLPRTAWATRMASNAAPSRWAFEGLLVSESEGRTPPGGEGDGRDLAEDYFPAETDRMGPRADAMALASMLIGLLGVGLFVVSSSGPSRGTPSGA